MHKTNVSVIAFHAVLLIGISMQVCHGFAGPKRLKLRRTDLFGSVCLHSWHDSVPCLVPECYCSLQKNREVYRESHQISTPRRFVFDPRHILSTVPTMPVRGGVFLTATPRTITSNNVPPSNKPPVAFEFGGFSNLRLRGNGTKADRRYEHLENFKNSTKTASNGTFSKFVREVSSLDLFL